jgi:competence protein ComEA
MKAGKFVNSWTLLALLLVIMIITGSVVVWLKSSHSQAIEISLAPGQEIEGEILVGGEVNNPGIYPIFANDNIEDIIRAAGGLKEGADLSRVELTICEVNEGEAPQKININRAEAWLLEALPGVGEARAQAIIGYRLQNGPFRDINELMKVPGFGDINFDKVKDLITVND